MSSALWHINENESKLIEEEISHDSNKILIKSLYSMISTGTEKLVATRGVSKHFMEKMSVPHMEGNFELPIKYGYSIVGEIISNHPLKNKQVHLMHPHQCTLQAYEKSCTIIPDGIPSNRAILTSNMETAVNAYWDAQAMNEDRILIIGFGSVGALLAEVCRLQDGSKPIILEKDKWRKQKAQELGFEIYEEQKPATKFDIIYNATGRTDIIQTSLKMLNLDGKYIELSWHGDQSIELNLGYEFHYNRLQIISSQVSNIPKHKKGEWDFKKRKDLVFELLLNPIFDQYLTNEISFEKAPFFFSQIRKNSLDSGIIYYINYQK